jgi:hypothetical protein
VCCTKTNLAALRWLAPFQGNGPTLFYFFRPFCAHFIFFEIMYARKTWNQTHYFGIHNDNASVVIGWRVLKVRKLFLLFKCAMLFVAL